MKELEPNNITEILQSVVQEHLIAEIEEREPTAQLILRSYGNRTTEELTEDKKFNMITSNKRLGQSAVHSLLESRL